MKKLILIFFSIIFICLPSIGLAKADAKSVVQIKIFDRLTQSYVSTGSGVFINSGLYVVTNYHVLEKTLSNPERYVPIICRTNSETSLPDCSYVFNVKYWGDDEFEAVGDLDLVLLTFYGRIIEGEIEDFWHLTMDEWGLSEVREARVSIYDEKLIGIKSGDYVQMLGYPDDGNDFITNSYGTVTDFIRNENGNIVSIETSAKIAPGSSGGGAFDKNDKFIGITYAAYSDMNDNFLSSLIIPVTTVNLWLKAQGFIIEEGKYRVYRGTSKERLNEALCLLKQGSRYGEYEPEKVHWDEKSKSCVCDDGYEKNHITGICEVQKNSITFSSNRSQKYAYIKFDDIPTVWEFDYEMPIMKPLCGSWSERDFIKYIGNNQGWQIIQSYPSLTKSLQNWKYNAGNCINKQN